MNRIADAARDRQRLLALERANHVRVARAELRRRLRSGEAAAAEVILRCSRDTDTMTVGELLRSQPGWGPTRSSTLLRSVSLPEAKTLGSLTERQRVMLAAVLGRDADHRQSDARGNRGTP
jgi:hypothetical protein